MPAPLPSLDPRAFANRWRMLAVLALSLVIIGLDNTILNVALPTLRDEFDASSSTLQWMVDSYLLVFAGLLLTMGTLGDRFGRKLALQSGIAIFGLASLAVLFVDSAGELIAVRAAMGVGGALIMPATLSIITNVFPREELGKAIAAWAGMAALGVGLGPLVGGALIEWLDWTWVFLVNVPVAALAFGLGVRLVPENRDPRPGAFDLPGAGLSIAALVSLVYGIIEAPERGWLDPLTLGAFGAAAVLTAAFIARELRTPEPMLNLSYFRNPRFSVASASISLAFFALFGSIFALTQYLQFAHGYSALEAGAAMAPIAIGLVAGARIGQRASEHLGTRRVVAIGLALLGGLLATSVAWTADMPYWPLGIFFFALAIAMGLVMAPATSSVMGAVPRERAGVASAMNDLTRQVGGALGVAVIGSIVATLYSGRISDATAGLPDGVAGPAEESVGAAVAVSGGLPGAQGERLATEAGNAFTDAMSIGFLAAAAVAVLAAVLAWRRLPDRDASRAAARAEPARA